MPEFDDGGESAAEEKSEQDSDETVDIRTYFPETWLWELYNIGEEAHLELSKEAPHTITDWIGSAFCTNQQTGFGVSDTITLRAFQPFFLSFTLPYSSVRGETLRTPVSVFNYLDKCIVVSISMESTNEVSVVDPSRKVCVCGSDTVTEYFMVTARKVGMVNLTATAVSVSNEDWRCENNLVEAIEPVRDAATRQLLIEPEGKREEYTISNFVCPSSGKHVEGSFELDLPDVGLVPDSAAAMVSVIGDVMGPTLSNLDQLVRMPMGCGEQNMILFAPNIYVVQYLEASNQMSSEIRSDAIQHMETGYQRELTYRHSDGSYSAFGESDESGSTWLTAFVVRCFAQARDYIFIDENDLTASIQWFRSIQKENGCFRQVGKVLHKDMKGGLGGSDGGAGLTAYVLVALIDAGIPSDDSMIQEGLGCLAISTDTDVYTAALITYVYSKLGDDYEDIQASMKEKMEEMATKEDGMKHWSKNRDEPPIDPEDFLHSHHRAGQSADVEMTSYALMAYLHMGGGDVEAIADGLAMVRWLSSQRNAQGGFHSTQDTVVALQALASYAQLVYRDDVSLRVVFSDTESTGSLRRSIHITSENSLLLHQHDVPVPNSITYRVSGTGCALLQANVRYHSDPSARRAKVQPFDVNVQVHHTRDIKKSHCAFRKLNICVRSRSQEPSNMAVVAVKMQTGWIPDKMSLKQMRKDGVKNLQRQEVDHNMVNLYFDELDEEKICLEFLVEEDMRVTDPKQAHVHVYDYYDTELSHVVNYFIRTTCGTKEELSELTPEEYGDLINGGFEGQIRQPVDFPFKDEEKLKCPLCYNEVPANFAQLLCDSLHAYKVVVKHNKIRLLADKKEKHPLNKITYIKEDSLGFSVEECRCPVLIDDLSVKPNKNSRLLVLTKSSLGEDDSGRQTRYSLDLSTHTTIVPLPRDTERAIQSSMQSCDV